MVAVLNIPNKHTVVHKALHPVTTIPLLKATTVLLHKDTVVDTVVDTEVVTEDNNQCTSNNKLDRVVVMALQEL